jgi:acetolactate synthase-1/2/3 large subunit
MAKQPKIKRRQFLAGALAAGPAATIAAATGKAAAQTQARAPPVPPVPATEAVLPDGTPLTQARSGSDYMVDVIKTLDIDYISCLPASTFAGFRNR